jgi:two-component system, cell cycle sensor histidine kinase and response regulator CckA
VSSNSPIAPAVLLADAQGRRTHTNQQWNAITRCESNPDSDADWIDFAHPEDRENVRATVIRAICSRTDFSVRVRPRWDDSRVRLFELKGTPLPSSDGEVDGFVITLEEVAEPDRIDAELLHARKMETVGRLASGLAHDFANLLTMISGYSEIILGRLGSHDALRAEIDEIRKAANRGSALTGQLLTFSRRHHVTPQVLDLNAVVADVQKMLRRMIGEHIEIQTYPVAELGHVRADPGQMEQVIMNLAINARDAMPRGGKISIRTANIDLDANHERVSPALAAGAYVMLQVSDTGEGMDTETLQHLFEPFFTTKEKGKGTGLGLATVFEIVKQGRGDISVQSERGRGTTFTIYMPRVEGTTRPTAEEPQGRTANSGNETILLVEDEDGVRRLLTHVLAQRGYKVLEARNGPEAFAIYQQSVRTVDLLLTDIVMPRMSGRELADRLLKLQPDLKVIYISGYTDEVLIGKGRHPDALFLQKPLRPDTLVAKVRALLDGTRAEHDAAAANCVQSGM